MAAIVTKSFKTFSRQYPQLKQAGLLTPVRNLNLHEYQAKDLMRKYNINVQKGDVADTPAGAVAVADKLASQGYKEFVIKSQIHAGGRGKGHFNTGYKGGVKVSDNSKAIGEYAEKFLGNHLITKQTGPEGQIVNKVLVLNAINIASEWYVAILLDRANNGPVFVVSPQGGMDIEEVAHKNPAAILTVPIDIKKGIQTADLAKISSFLTAGQKVNVKQSELESQLKNLYELFIKEESTQVEINPWVTTKEGEVLCVDAKVLLDDNSSFRHADVHALRDFAMEDPREVAASKYNLNYIGLDGNIGCMVNGAGLAMATMDIIKLNGGAPANFLDVGGGATEKQVEEAFKILTSDPHVKALLVNIFGGIMKCDVIATGIVNAAKKVGLKIPLVVRLEGTNVDKGIKILNESGLKLTAASNLDQAAKYAVASLKQ